MEIFKECKWIAKSGEKYGVAPLMRKTFLTEKPVKKAVLYACGHGYGDYRINGANVTDEVLTTPVTKYDTTVMYNRYNVTKLIKNGKNVITVILGNGCYCVNYPRWDEYKAPWVHHPKLILCLEIIFKDGTNDRIVTDSSWKVCASPIIYNETRRGEIYAAVFIEQFRIAKRYFFAAFSGCRHFYPTAYVLT